MAFRISILAVLCLASFAASVWSSELRIATAAIPSKFAFTDIELLRDDQNVEAAGSSAEPLETFARPLFSRNRRPYQAAEKPDPETEPALPVMTDEESPTPELERPQLKLLGTEPVSPTPSALIALEETGTSSWYRKGELIVGWRLTRIGPDDIELSNKDDETVNFNISLYPDER